MFVHAIKELQAGRPTVIHPRGHSMKPAIQSGDRVELRPVELDDLSVGDIVLCRVRGKTYLHRVKAKDRRNGGVLIGSDRGSINGWTRTVYGRVA